MSRSTVLSLANHALAGVLLVLASSFSLDLPVWRAPKAMLLVVGLFAGAYLTAALVIVLTRPSTRATAALSIASSLRRRSTRWCRTSKVSS